MPEIPPLPREAFLTPGVPLTKVDHLQVGDVLLVAVQLTDKVTGQPFWWRRFTTVLQLPEERRWGWDTHLTLVSLKMHIDPDKDIREVDLRQENQVVTWIPPDQVPAGVAAMLMKHLALGTIKL